MKQAIQLTDQQFADVLPDAVIVLDQQAKTLWWNLAAQNLFKLNTESHTGVHIDSLLNSFSFDNYFSEKIQKSVEIKLPENNIRLSISITPYSRQHYVLLAHNITHVHRLEKMRQDLIANVSHELRTPLTVIHGYLEILIDQFPDESSWQDIFKKIYQQSLRMESLVEDLLLLSLLETDYPEPDSYQEVHVAAMLTAIVNDAKILSGKKNHQIHLVADENLTLFGVEKELRSAFSNIIFNAIDYTPHNGQIEISWYGNKENIYFTVKDTGIGIDSRDIPRLTERFYRADKARSRVRGGTGLGLAIVKHVLIRHRAYLKIESELGKGSSFTCVFPKV